MTRVAKVFQTSHRVSFLDLDPFGHMNTVQYAKYFIEHRFQGVREVLKLDLNAISALPFIFVIQKLDLEFVRPLLADDLFHIRSSIVEMGDLHCIVGLEMARQDGKVAAKVTMRLVCVDKASNRPGRWDAVFMERFFESGSEA